MKDIDIEQSSLTHEQIEKVKDLLDKNSDIVCKNDLDLGYTDIVKHRIRTTDDKPIAIPHRRIPPNQMEEVRAHIKQLLNQNIIRKSSSPYAAPVVIVRKHDQSIRICVDYRQLNKKTIRDAYPLPRIKEALDTLHGTKYYTSLDLSQGYYQVATDERDIHKTAFRVGTGGLYEYLRMPMGLSNSAATFQKIMEACFNDTFF